MLVAADTHARDAFELLNNIDLPENIFTACDKNHIKLSYSIYIYNISNSYPTNESYHPSSSLTDTFEYTVV